MRCVKKTLSEMVLIAATASRLHVVDQLLARVAGSLESGARIQREEPHQNCTVVGCGASVARTTQRHWTFLQQFYDASSQAPAGSIHAVVGFAARRTDHHLTLCSDIRVAHEGLRLPDTHMPCWHGSNWPYSGLDTWHRMVSSFCVPVLHVAVAAVACAELFQAASPLRGRQNNFCVRLLSSVLCVRKCGGPRIADVD